MKRRQSFMVIMTVMALGLSLIVMMSCTGQSNSPISSEQRSLTSAIFPLGELVTNNNFIGDTYLQMLVNPEAPHNTSVGNVTFSPGARNNWHSHEVAQFLLVTYGTGFYQEDGQPARLLQAGDFVNIPANVRHWHGASPDDWFVHIAITPGMTNWYDALTDTQYEAATRESMNVVRQSRIFNIRNQTAGRNALSGFAPKFAELNDDVLFGQVWSREIELSRRNRSLITVAAIISSGNFNQLTSHLNFAKQNGLTKNEISAIITHLAFYAGWPKAWSAFNIATGIFTEEDTSTSYSRGAIFPLGEIITNNNFIGDTYLQMLINPDPRHNISVGNVTFSPGARNNWHSHDTAQFLLVTYGTGFYQEDGKPSRLLQAGDVVQIPANIRHWHGAAPDEWFVHIAVTPGSSTWFEALTDAQYETATRSAMNTLRQGRVDVRNQTAGRNVLGEFAPAFAAFNDDVLFGQIWSRESELSMRDRSMITITALISTGNFGQLNYHMNFGKQNGITKTEISEVITHLGFYLGWPPAWSAFNIATEIYK